MSGFRIRDFRKAKGLFQGEMAKILGLTQSNLSRYETNNIGLSDAQLNKLRLKYGKEDVDAYITDDTKRNSRESDKHETALLDLINIAKKQNDTICQQIEQQNESVRQLTNINERMLSLLEKVSFK